MIFAEKGPVYIGEGAQIMANSVVRGPAAICEKSVIKMGAKIYEDTTIGPVCKVGGEVANVIFHSYSNKAHDGYAGNSVFGQWCNLGADTNTSNLKNNYSTVKVIDWRTKKEIDTGQQFIGTIMGDHSKTGINAMLNTGTLCGVCCNLFSDDYPPKFVPSFSWVSGNDIVPYHFEKAVEAMERMMQRRDVPLTPSYHRMMKAIFQATSF
jgi:UDP-N-acetylglucosamine diphosphorylase/glucosamine-1-phosphate N-acetyltransferase